MLGVPALTVTLKLLLMLRLPLSLAVRVIWAVPGLPKVRLREEPETVGLTMPILLLEAL